MHPSSSISDTPPLDLSDLDAILHELPSLYQALDMGSFPLICLRMINKLIPKTLFSSYNEVEMRTGSARIFFEPSCYAELGEKQKPGLWKFKHQHPIMRLYEEGDHEGVRMISDFLPAAELHKLELHSEVLNPMGIEDTLSFTLPSTRDLKVFYAVNSPETFDERDRAIAGILQPHFVQAFSNALAFSVARSLAALSAHAFRAESHGLLLVDFSGRIIHASETASTHLSHFLPEEEARAMPFACNEFLPAELIRWLQGRGERRHVAFETEISAGVSLMLRASIVDDTHWVIATNEQDVQLLARHLSVAYQLSCRQGDVLLWLSRGKSNGDIACVLEISERTVAKHIEHLFEKLGVENRYAATRKAIEALGF